MRGMKLDVIESFVAGKSETVACEDIVVATDDHAAVVDGGTDLSGARFAGKAGGLFAAEVVADQIKGAPRDLDATSFVAQLTDALARAVRAEHGALGPDTLPPCASFVCVSVARRQVWRVGDCTAVVDGTPHYGGKLVDDAAYSFRAALTAALLAGGTPLATVLADDPGTQACRPLYDIQQNLGNQLGRWGYGVVNGTPVPDDLVEVFDLPADECEIILASDGYPEVLPTLDETERRLHDLLAADPAAVGPLWRVGKSLRPGYASMDDRSFLRLRLPA
jgi:hypothetical protein